MEGLYAQADLLRVYRAILNASAEIAYWLRYHTRNYFLGIDLVSEEDWGI